MNSPGPTGRSPLDQASAHAGRDDLDWMRGLDECEVVCGVSWLRNLFEKATAYRFASCCGHSEDGAEGGREGGIFKLEG